MFINCGRPPFFLHIVIDLFTATKNIEITGTRTTANVTLCTDYGTTSSTMASEGDKVDVSSTNADTEVIYHSNKKFIDHHNSRPGPTYKSESCGVADDRGP